MIYYLFIVDLVVVFILYLFIFIEEINVREEFLC